VVPTRPATLVCYSDYFSLNYFFQIIFYSGHFCPFNTFLMTSAGGISVLQKGGTNDPDPHSPGAYRTQW
jgi:hypothetical protein